MSMWVILGMAMSFPLDAAGVERPLIFVVVVVFFLQTIQLPPVHYGIRYSYTALIS